MQHVILVEPRYTGNIGLAARAMANFGLTHLHLVNPPKLDDEARKYAVHAGDVLQRARIHAALEEALQEFDLAIGFTGILGKRPNSHLRHVIPLSEAAPLIQEMRGRVALVFGREDDGLHLDELPLVDLLVTIPTTARYESMNLANAVAVACYAVSTTPRLAPVRSPLAKGPEKRTLRAMVEEAGRHAGLPEYRVHATTNAFLRMVGRARMTTWEYHRIMGLFVELMKKAGHAGRPKRPT